MKPSEWISLLASLSLSFVSYPSQGKTGGSTERPLHHINEWRGERAGAIRQEWDRCRVVLPRGVLNELTEAAAEADRVVWIAAQNGLAQSVSIVCNMLAEVVARILRRLAATSIIYIWPRVQKNGMLNIPDWLLA
jgi:hypothetical protein